MISPCVDTKIVYCGDLWKDERVIRMLMSNKFYMSVGYI